MLERAKETTRNGKYTYIVFGLSCFTTRPITITEAGEPLPRRADNNWRNRNPSQRLIDESQLNLGRVALRATPTIAAGILPQAIASFRRG
jgi:DNA-binding transcriptional LysR family regulator